jgi:putative spermidine/putrescine transport system substrate-binding protein
MTDAAWRSVRTGEAGCPMPDRAGKATRREVAMTLRKDGGFGTALAAGMLLAGVALAPSAEARDLTVVSWGGVLQDAQHKYFFVPFQEQTKIKMQEASWDGGIGIVRAKVQGGNLDWDLIEVESDELALGCEEGLYVKLDWSKMGGKDIYIPATVTPCGIAAILYNFGLGYDADKLKDGPKSWVDFFDLQKYPGKRALRSGPKSTLEIALMGDGVDAKDVYKLLATSAGVDRAFKKLDSIKSSTIWWQTGSQPVQFLNNGEVAMTAIYNGRIAAADRADPTKHYKMVWNQSLFTSDSWVILKGSPNIEAAYKLLDFMSDPERQKEIAIAVTTGMSNKKTAALIPKEVLANLPTAPENLAHALEINVPFWLENYDKLNDRYTKWAAQ